MNRSRVQRSGRNLLVVLACAPIAGAMAIGGDLGFILLSPWLTRAMSNLGLTNRTTSEVAIDLFADPFGALLFFTIVCVLGLIGTLIALVLVGLWFQRRPRWTRAVRMMLPALALAALPWVAIVMLSECVAHVMEPNQQGMQLLRLGYVFGGPIVSLLTYRLLRGGWRQWNLYRPQGHIPREPCRSCGYELHRTCSNEGTKRCPECGSEQSAEFSLGTAKNAAF